jgi:subtilase family serine protease
MSRYSNRPLQDYIIQLGASDKTAMSALQILAVLGALLHNVSCFPFKSVTTNDQSNRRLMDGLLDAQVDGGKNSMHRFRETAAGLNSHPDFLKGSRASPSEIHDVVFVVKEKNMDELKRILMDVSDPLSANYGNHMTPREVADLVSNPVAHQEVISYLSAAGATVIFAESQGECITARAEVGVWERMLNTEFHTYSKVSPASDSQWPANSKTEFIRSEKYSVPAGLDDHVAFVMNTIQTPELKYQRDYLDNHHPISSSKNSRSLSNTIPGWTSPAQMMKAYSIDDTTGHPRATQGAFEAFGQKFSTEDLLQFQRLYGLPETKVNKTYAPAVLTAAQCTAAGTSICVESNIDIQYMLAMSDSPTIHYYQLFNTFAQWAQYVATSGDMPPLIVSVSYGNDEELYSPGEYQTFESATIKMGAMGCTILIASGDDGVHTGQTRNNAKLCGYKPQYPTGCPYVISVGATQVLLVAIVIYSCRHIGTNFCVDSDSDDSSCCHLHHRELRMIYTKVCARMTEEVESPVVAVSPQTMLVQTGRKQLWTNILRLLRVQTRCHILDTPQAEATQTSQRLAQTC